MKRAWLLALASAIGLSAFALPPAGAAETWNPTSARSANVPVPGSGQYYQYAPSIVQLSETERIIYYCANRLSGQVWDHIGVNRGTRQADGSYAWGPTSYALNPQSSGVPPWASRHICDPDVLRGSFTYQGHQYAWAMFFTGYPDEARYPNATRKNFVGVAYADSPDGPWRIAQQPLLDERTEGPLSDWGVGQPSATAIGGGRVLLFYSGLDDIVRREVDLTNADAPVLGARVQVPTDGLTPEPGSSNVWFHNANFAYDPARDEFVVNRDFGQGNGLVQPEVEVATIPGPAIWSGTGTWTVKGSVNPCHSGFPMNHNSGIVRNAFAAIADPIDVYFAIGNATTDFFAYRIWEAKSPLAFVSGSRPELVAQADGRLVAVGSSANRCEANVWTSTQTSAGGEFGTWQRFGASPAGRPVAARQPDGRVALFSRAADGTIWANVQSGPNGPFPGWVQLPSSASATDPAVGTMRDGRLVVAIRRNEAPGSRVYLNVQQSPNGAFASSWQDLGASPTGAPTFGANQDGSLVLFARADTAAGGQIWFSPQLAPDSSGWAGWRVVDGSVAFDGGPTVARQADGRLVVAARRWEGSASVVYVNTQLTANGTAFATSWTSLGASPANDPVLAVQTDGRLAMLARAADGGIWWARQDAANGPFIGWGSLGGSAANDPVAVMRADRRLDLVVRWSDGRVLHRVQNAPGSAEFGAWTTIL